MSKFLRTEVSQKIPDWAQSFEPSNKFRFLGGWTKNQIEALTTELNQIRLDITGISTGVSEKGISGIERILSAASGLLISPGAAVMGGTFGFKEMLKGLPGQLGAIAGLVLLNITNPWLIIATLVAAGSIQALLKSVSITDTVKKRVAEEMAKSIRNKDKDIADAVVNDLNNKLEQLFQVIRGAMDKEIQDICDQVEIVLAEKRKGQAATDARKSEIHSIERSMFEIDKKLTDFIFVIAK